MRQAGLRCVTEADLVASGAIAGRSHVEHICLSDGLDLVSPVLAWDRVDDQGVAASDHPTLAVDLVINPRSPVG